MIIKITAEILKLRNACRDGLAAFESKYPAGLDYDCSGAEAQIRQLLTCEVIRRYWGWAVAAKILPAWSMRNANLRNANLSVADLYDAITTNAIGLKK